jgi:uncharacterized membrane protein (GlpM family)
MVRWADAAQFALRFTVGGVIVASIPLIAKRMSPEASGIVALIPAVTLSGFTFLWLDQGNMAVQRASLAAAASVPAVLAYLLMLSTLLRNNVAFPLAMFLAIAVWLAVAFVVSQGVSRWL